MFLVLASAGLTLISGKKNYPLPGGSVDLLFRTPGIPIQSASGAADQMVTGLALVAQQLAIGCGWWWLHHEMQCRLSGPQEELQQAVAVHQTGCSRQGISGPHSSS